MGGRAKKRGRIPSRLHAVSAEPDVGLKLMKLRDHDLSRNQELNASLTEPPRHPGESSLFSNSNWNSVIVINLQKRNFPSAHLTFSASASTPGRKLDVAGNVAATSQVGDSSGHLEKMITCHHPL